MKNDIINLGILGCARNVPVSILYPLKNVARVRLVGIAGRTRERGEASAARFGVPRAFASYADLVESRDIDLVCIMLPNSLHCEWAVQAAGRGKHVLVEKPACLTAGEFALMMKAAGDNGIELLEAVMTGHHPWQNQVRLIAEESRLGSLKEIRTSISFLPKDNFHGNYRSFPEMGGGVFYDLGSYWLQLTQKLISVTDAACRGASRFDGPNGCDWSFEARLTTPAGIAAFFEGSFAKPYQARHEILFESGSIALNDIFSGNLGHHRLRLDVSTHDPRTAAPREFEPYNYFENQLNFFADVILGKRKNIPLSETLERIELMEKIYSSAKSS